MEDPAVTTAVKAYMTIQQLSEGVKLLRREQKALLARLTPEQLLAYAEMIEKEEE
jgi:hypothetical protein